MTAEQTPKTPVELLVEIMEKSQVKSPELAAKQARLLALLRASLPPLVEPEDGPPAPPG